MSRWFRFYDDAINDPKILKLSDACFRGWVGILCVASKNKGSLPPITDLAFHLRVKPQRAAELLTQLAAAGLLDKTDEGFEPHNWGGRQYVSDSTERVKRHRQKREEAGLEAQWAAPKALRKEIYARDNYECVYCSSPDDLTLDHKTPEIRGGTHDASNLQTACRKCNASKRDLTHEEFVARGVTKTVTGNVTSGFQERPQSTEQITDQKQISEANASGAEAPLDDPSRAEREYFARGREVLGKSAGGQLAKLLKANGGNVSLSRSTLELAATKHRPAEFFARAVAPSAQGPPPGRGGFTQILIDKHMERQNGTSDSEAEFFEH